MPAYFESGFMVRTPAWHNEGVLLQRAPTIAEGLVAAGLDWQVELQGLRTTDGQDVSSFGRAVRRSNDGKVLGVVGPNFVPLQNRKAFEWFAPFIDSGECELHTAGSLKGGSVIWILAEIKREPLQIATINGKDEIKKFFLLSNSHDGSQAVRVKFTGIRVVCANTLGMAHLEKSAQIRVKHTAGMHLTLAAVRETVDMVDRDFKATAEQYQYLANRRISKSNLKRYVKTVMFGDSAAERSAKSDQKIADICQRAESGYGQSAASLSLWQAYNGVTEYLSYAAGRNSDTRLSSLWFGENAGILDRALKTAYEMAV